ncbi:hypothetical protein RQP46_010619 [Phenoliferia psychrophenolica]
MEPLRISKRSQALLDRGRDNPLLHALIRTFGSQYSDANPSGVINCGLAENSLMLEWLTAFFEKNLKLEPTDFTYGDIKLLSFQAPSLTLRTAGTSLVGSTRIFAALGPFYTSYFAPITPVLPQHLICANGLTPMLDALATALCDPGELILIPTPYYNSFPDDLSGKARVEVLNGIVPDGAHGELGEIAALEETMQAHTKSGGAKVRAVLVTNPHNPLGFVYRREILEAYARFAEKWDLYLIVDEIYALSIYESDLPAVPFTSILNVDVASLGVNPARIIQLYGMSKDFGANGFRVGVMVVQHNPLLHGAISAGGMLLKIGSPVDALWSSLLTSPNLPLYLTLNQAALSSAYKFTTTWLTSHSIPFRPAHSGHFVLIDLRAFLPTSSKTDLEGELALLAKFVSEGVYLGPGFSYGVKTKGFFRLTFSIRRELLEIGMARIERVLGLQASVRGKAGEN